MKYGVAIGGSARKTTTTSMTAEVLAAAGLDPTTIVGGRVISLDSNSRLGAGEVLVAEADESDGSFLRLVPTVVVITNIDRDHVDHYVSFENLPRRSSSSPIACRSTARPCSCIDDPHVQTLLPQVTRRVWTYGLSPQADVCAERVQTAGLGMRFEARARGTALGPFTLRVPGRHNVQNALAALNPWGSSSTSPCRASPRGHRPPADLRGGGCRRGLVLQRARALPALLNPVR